MNCIVIEDQPPAQRILKKYIRDIGSLELKGVFSDAIQAMEFLKTEPVDLIFLDIHLPKLSGIDFLKAQPQAPHVILTTAFDDYALEGYELNVVDYLLKPFSFQRFVKAVSKVPVRDAEPSTSTHSYPEFIFLKSGYEHIKVTIEDILYIQSDADYTELVVPGKKHLSTHPLRYWLHELDPGQFIQIHKSYIIHQSKIEKITGGQVYLSDGSVLPIGRTYKEDFLKKVVR
jgi:DNA-binding LytR/AlgR family response regulator